MSRIANYPVAVPPKVDVTLNFGEIIVKGPLGTLTQKYRGDVEIEREGDKLMCKARNGGTAADAMSGTLRALVANMVKGVTDGFEKNFARRCRISRAGARRES
jgi:large subunit ribosomal protein L6